MQRDCRIIKKRRVKIFEKSSASILVVHRFVNNEVLLVCTRVNRGCQEMIPGTTCTVDSTLGVHRWHLCVTRLFISEYKIRDLREP